MSFIQVRLGSNVLKLSNAVHEYRDDSLDGNVLSPGHKLHPNIGSDLIAPHLAVLFAVVMLPMIRLAATFALVPEHDLPTVAHVSSTT